VPPRIVETKSATHATIGPPFPAFLHTVSGSCINGSLYHSHSAMPFIGTKPTFYMKTQQVFTWKPFQWHPLPFCE
jgi:hypothetical protein